MFHSLKRFLLGLPGFERLCLRLTRGHVRTIMYHRFVGTDDLGIRHLDAAEFERQVAYLARLGNVITPLDHLAALNGETTLPAAPVVLTIDDGYRDFHDLAFPILERYGLPAVFFPTCGFVDGSIWFWWDQLAYALRQAAAGRYEVQLGSTTLEADLRTAAGRIEAWYGVSGLSIARPVEERDTLLAQLFDQLGVEPPGEPPSEYAPVTWEELRTMAEQGITIGAHTVTHPILSRVDSGAARAEIRESRRRLTECIGAEPRIFCFPQGGPSDWTVEHKQMVREEGFEACYASFPDHDLSRDPFSLPRYGSTGDWTQFRWVVSGAEYLVLRMRKVYHTLLRSKAPYWAVWRPHWD